MNRSTYETLQKITLLRRVGLGGLFAVLVAATPALAQTVVNGSTQTVSDTSTWNLNALYPSGDSRRTLHVGENNLAAPGSSRLNIVSGGAVTNTSGYIGHGVNSDGVVRVTGPGAAWINTGDLAAGYRGVGALAVEDGGGVTAAHGLIGTYASGAVEVAGAGSRWAVADGISIGVYGTGDGLLNIRDGGAVTTAASTTALAIGNGTSSAETGARGTVNVDGAGSKLTVDGPFLVARYGTGVMNITGGGVVSTPSGMSDLGYEPGSSGTVTVDGPGSRWTVAGYLAVGLQGSGTLRITNGGVVEDPLGYEGSNAGASFSATGAVTVDGAGSAWLNAGQLYIASAGSGWLTIANGALVTAAGVRVGQAGGTGTINIGAAQGNPAAPSGRLDTPAVSLAAPCLLVFNHTDVVGYLFAPVISGAGTLKQTGSGATVLTGDSSAFAGSASVHRGALLVNGTLGNASSAVVVEAGGTLGGTGVIGGHVSVGNGGTLKPGDGVTPGLVTAVRGNLTFEPGARYVVNADQGTASLARVNGTVALDGVAVELSFAAPPELSVGDQIVLLDASAGAITGAPASTAVTAGHYQFTLSVNGNNQLIATLSGLAPMPPGERPIPAQSPTMLMLVTFAMAALAFGRKGSHHKIMRGLKK